MRVAVATGQPVSRVWRQSYAVTLWTYTMWEEHERIVQSEAIAARIDEAFLFNVAMHNGLALKDVRATFERSLTSADADRAERDALRAKYQRLIRAVAEAELSGAVWNPMPDQGLVS